MARPTPGSPQLSPDTASHRPSWAGSLTADGTIAGPEWQGLCIAVTDPSERLTASVSCSKSLWQDGSGDRLVVPSRSIFERTAARQEISPERHRVSRSTNHAQAPSAAMAV